MLNERLKNKIDSVDVLTDFDEVIIRQQSIYMQLHAYFSILPLKAQWNFCKKLVGAYRNYEKTGDVSFAYFVYEGCPVEIIDKTVYDIKKNPKWSDLVHKLNVKKVGIVSRNSARIIFQYLNLVKDSFEGVDLQIIAANEPEIEEGTYTGRVKVSVSNNNLKDFVYDKGYICGSDERRILEAQGFPKPSSKNGLFIFGNV